LVVFEENNTFKKQFLIQKLSKNFMSRVSKESGRYFFLGPGRYLVEKQKVKQPNYDIYIIVL
jgi:hypothetical protein